ncbi:restriction endonuclease subunit S [Mycoplasma yeatsii]|uniref:Restriction endonuclease S subunit n=1 Tax=Mycoplasma yeatsii TaxID=51365 RepID=A0ABU0NEM7_9MOLU|nr:restriction endonuclease subunit S [Mycoplasma yeatsii]MDQ0567870.1 restriction endonuclease S subunit [Mycoplasma yeatsii]
MFKNEVDGLVSPIYEVFKVDENHNPDFFYLWFRTENFKKIISSNSNKSVRDTLKLSEFEDHLISFSKISEQIKISYLFSNLDSLITLHQRKLEILKINKFEQNFLKFLSLFFEKCKNYTNTWEQWKVGEIFNIDRGLGITKKDMSLIKTGEFKYPVYSSQTTENGLIGYYNKYTFENAITWTTDGAKAGTVFYRKHSFFATSHCGILTKKHFNVNEYFSIIISKNTSKSVTWVAMPMLTTSEMEKMKIISSSDPKEQQKISLLISNLDSLITLHQCELKILKITKFEQIFLKFLFLFFGKCKNCTNTWEQEKLGNICEVITGGEPPKDSIRRNKPTKEYKYPIFSNGLEDRALWGFSKTYTISKPAITISSIGTIGNPEIRNEKFTPIIRLKTILPKNQTIHIHFLKYSLSIVNFNHSDAGIPSVNSEEIKKIELISPNNFREQDKIGKIFYNLDSLITLHQRKLEILKITKFEQNFLKFLSLFFGKFKNYTNTWEQWKVGEIFNIDRGLGITKKDMSLIKTGEFKYPVYSSQTTENGLIGYYNKYTFENAITWTTDGAKAGTVFYRKHSFFATSHCGILTKKHFNVNEYFSIIISKNTSKSVTWVAMPMLTTSEMEKMKIISSSDPKEQQKISLLISNLDSLITLHQRG